MTDFDQLKDIPPSPQDTPPQDLAILNSYFGTPGSNGGVFSKFRWIAFTITTVVIAVILNPWLMSWVKTKGVNQWLIYLAQIVIMGLFIFYFCWA
jgi:hypothetical protein